jgi:hypothetical protein
MVLSRKAGVGNRVLTQLLASVAALSVLFAVSFQVVSIPAKKDSETARRRAAVLLVSSVSLMISRRTFLKSLFS